MYSVCVIIYANKDYYYYYYYYYYIIIVFTILCYLRMSDVHNHYTCTVVLMLSIFSDYTDLKIVNGRVGREMHIGHYTCYTSRGKSTIDYAVVSMDLFSSIDDFYIDVLDKCMSDVHCPICLTISCNKTV